MSVTNGAGTGQPLVTGKQAMSGRSFAPALPRQEQEPPIGGDDILIGSGVSTCGTFKTAGSIFVDGVLQDATIEASLLSISRGGELSGSVKANRVEIAGRLNGKAEATEEIVLRVTAEVDGTLSAPYLVVHRGASIRGETRTLERSKEENRLAPPPYAPLRRRPGNRTMVSVLIAGLVLGCAAVWAWLSP